MRALYIPVEDDTLQKLGRLARLERRHPKDTAAILLEKAIDEADRIAFPSFPPPVLFKDDPVN